MGLYVCVGVLPFTFLPSSILTWTRLLGTHSAPTPLHSTPLYPLHSLQSTFHSPLQSPLHNPLSSTALHSALHPLHSPLRSTPLHSHPFSTPLLHSPASHLRHIMSQFRDGCQKGSCGATARRAFGLHGREQEEEEDAVSAEIERQVLCVETKI